MANNKFNKILFCRFSYPAVDELAEWNVKHLKQADKCIKTLNDTVVGPDGEFDNEFWFLNRTIKGKTHIIIFASQWEYPTNDPKILAKLEAYLKEDNNNEGSAHNRSTTATTTLATHNTNITTVKFKTKGERFAGLLKDKLIELIGDKCEIRLGVEGEGYFVEITSYSLTRQEIYDIIYEIKPKLG